MTGDACGKAILLGEHFVVHGGPALAAPLPGLRARVVARRSREAGLRIDAPVPELSPVVSTVERALSLLGVPGGGWDLSVTSDVPLGCGLGSSAAFSVALVRALASALGRAMTPAEVSDAAFELEKIAHGTPSGVDNTVVAHEQAVLFARGEPHVYLRSPVPLPLIVADTGLRHPTSDAVSRVRAYALASEAAFREALAEAREVVREGRRAFEAGDAASLGAQMSRNHGLLREIGVSSEPLETLVAVARNSGALGAKLTGAGIGGSVVAIVRAGGEEAVRDALIEAGAKAVHVNYLE